jgi:hypothetical protein
MKGSQNNGDLTPPRQFDVNSVLKVTKRKLADTDFKDEDSPFMSKKPKLEKLEELFNKMQHLKSQSNMCAQEWRTLRDSLEFIKSPRSDEKK